MVSKIWVGMSTTNNHLFQFQIQGHLQKRGLISAICLYFHSLFMDQILWKNSFEKMVFPFLAQTSTTILFGKVGPLYFWCWSTWTPLTTNGSTEDLEHLSVKMVHSSQDNTKSIVRQSQICYWNLKYLGILKELGVVSQDEGQYIYIYFSKKNLLTTERSLQDVIYIFSYF